MSNRQARFQRRLALRQATSATESKLSTALQRKIEASKPPAVQRPKSLDQKIKDALHR